MELQSTGFQEQGFVVDIPDRQTTRVAPHMPLNTSYSLDPTMSLSYTKLNPDANEIRLLTIWPDENVANPVRGSLHPVSLKDPYEFEALSYVWGNVAIRTDIWVDCCIVSAPTNLEQFLRALREPKQDRVVWVDYLCINQHDILERNSQVLLMSQIYINATSVIAWLGLSTPNIEDAIAYQNYCEGLSTPKSKWWFEIHDKKDLSIEESRKRDLAMMDVLDGTLEILSAPYWQRLWTFQEWHLPKTRPICMFGKLCFTFRDVFSRLGSSFNSIDDMMAKYRKTVGQNLDGEAKEFSEKMLEREKAIHTRTFRNFLPILPGDLLVQKDLHKDPNSPPSRPLGELLSVTTHRNCSNPLDRVYALYAMAPLAQEKYPPDYQKTVSQLIHETTAYVLQYEGNTRILDYFCFSDDEALPSWVVDVTITDQRRRDLIFAGRSEQTTPERSLWKKPDGYLPKITDNLRTLQLRGRVIGVVQESFRLNTEKHAPLREIPSYLQRIREDEWISPFSMADTLISACYNYTESWSWMSYAYFSETLSKLNREGNLRLIDIADARISIFLDSFSKLKGKCLFSISSIGDSAPVAFGFIDCHIKGGDILFIASGISQVLVLRPLEDGVALIENRIPCCKIVGRTFVEGIAERQKSQPTAFAQRVKDTPVVQVDIK
ncbi:hypothetical protein BO94DRAFT_625795 [Aspergillus sclerotioniger CBS 115572]|uniref:Heterokaryon incompatibility domain-containing protein n=1 Tax=Aspergillus sclerotioniger CBS 115572 TaxID=1450535 RepID=A0A317W7K1_9EURO|nr:hypothetical protein BO94DRAFT_625795 [Aspergillus sclerotioniger CBS 115572]PWY81651.1 hypothetical protein BO94DRAFT_625795 [Aspergillus sclerotioniger CBS 115572]